MRKFIGSLSAGIAVTAMLAGCQPKAKPAEGDAAFLERLRSEDYTELSSTALDVDALLGALPDNAVVSYGSSEFNEATGATIITDLTLSLSEHPGAGLRAETVRIWGMDGDGLAARLSGERSESVTKFASRLEIETLEVFGLESLLSDSLPKIEAAITGDDDGIQTSTDMVPAFELHAYDFSVERVVATNFEIHPSAFKSIELSEDGKDMRMALKDMRMALHIAQRIADYSGMLSYDALAYYGTEFDFDISTNGERMIFDGGMEIFGSRDYHRGDMGYSVSLNTAYDMTTLIEDEDGGAAQSISMGTHVAKSEMRDMKLAKALNHFARGVMPERSETDFMSFGTFANYETTSTIGGEPFYTLETSTLDMSEFHWLIPEVIEYRGENAVYNLTGLMEYIKSEIQKEISVDLSDDEELAEVNAMIEKSIAILTKHGLGEPSLDFDFLIRWDGETGHSSAGYGIGIDDFGRYSTRLNAILPDFETAMADIPETAEGFETFEWDSWGAIFAEMSKLKRYENIAVDEGGFEKTFAMLKEFAALAPEDEPAWAPIRANSPEQMRKIAANSLMLAGMAFNSTFPPGAEYMQSVTNFINEGGELRITVEPPEPVGLSDLQVVPMMVPDEADKVVEMLGLSVTHEPAK